MAETQSVLHGLAGKVATKYYGENAAFDPAIIYTFVDLFVKVLQAIQQCKAQPEDPPVTLKTHPVMSRLFVRLRLREEMGVREFRKSRGDDLVNAAIDVAEQMTAAEWTAVYDELDHD